MQTNAAAVSKAAEIFVTQGRLAMSISVSDAWISMIINGKRECDALTAVKIHQATEGKVPKWEIRPDLFDKPKRPKPKRPRRKKKSGS